MKVCIKKGEYIDGKLLAGKLGIEYGHDEDIDDLEEQGEPIEIEIVYEGDENDGEQ